MARLPIGCPIIRHIGYVECGDVDSEDSAVRSAWRREAAGALQCSGRLASNKATREAMELREGF